MFQVEVFVKRVQEDCFTIENIVDNMLCLTLMSESRSGVQKCVLGVGNGWTAGMHYHSRISKRR